MIFPRMKEIRENAGLKQKDIAEVMGVSKGSYSMWECGTDTIPLKRLNQFCNYFNVSIDYIFGFTNIKKYKNLRENINIELSSQRLKSIRKENNLTQIKLADILNVDNSMLAKYEKGKYIIATTYLYQICKRYNISADYLLGKIDSPKYLNK